MSILYNYNSSKDIKLKSFYITILFLYFNLKQKIYILMKINDFRLRKIFYLFYIFISTSKSFLIILL